MFPNVAIVAAAKIRAEEEAKKKKDAKPEIGDGPPAGGLPPVGLGAPLPSAQFRTGAAVRDILSGVTGVVVEPLDGNFGDLIFVKSDEDGQTHPIRSDQLEAVKPAGGAPLPAPMPASPVAEPAAPPAPMPAPAAPAGKPAPMPKASKMAEGFIVTDLADARKLTYASVLASAKTMASEKPLTAAALLASFGYVPESWDRVLAALAEDGVVVLRSATKVDIRAMVARDMNAREIIYEACAAQGAVRGETARRISAVRGGMALARRVVAARKVAAEKPTKPMPSSDPGPGMVWAWDGERDNWYAMAVSA